MFSFPKSSKVKQLSACACVWSVKVCKSLPLRSWLQCGGAMWTTNKEVCRWYVLLGSWEALLEFVRHLVETKTLLRVLYPHCCELLPLFLPLFPAPATPRLFSLLISPVFWVGQERSGSLGHCPIWLEKLGAHYTLTFPTGKVLVRWVSLHTVFFLEERWDIKWNCSSSSVHLFSDFCIQQSAVATPLDSPATKMVLSFVSGCQNHFSVRNECSKFLFHHLADITLLISFLLYITLSETMAKLKLIPFFRTNQTSFMIIFDMTDIFMIFWVR